MHIAMVSAECAPIAKAGGLGDFVQGLAHELVRRGERVEVLLPQYDSLPLERINGLHDLYTDLCVPFHDRRLTCHVRKGHVDDIPCILFDACSEQKFFARGRIYGESDDAERFAFFARAVLEFIRRSGQTPDILHCNDWQTGLLPVLLHELGSREERERSRVCYTLHNLGYQGVVDVSILRQVGLDPERLMVPGGVLDPKDRNAANLMKGGIQFADFVNTVSPRYAWEVQNTYQGMGLESLLVSHGGKFGGILNGIDDSVWNPEVDRLIPANFGLETLPRKAINRQALRARLGLREAEAPILAIISRLDHQKGVDLMYQGIRYALAHGCQAVLLGTALDPRIQAVFQGLHQEMASNLDCHIELGYDEGLAHLIYAGADMILIPSLYEPCGLTQMIAMQYGTVPIVRRVGGLADTVFDANYSDQPFEARNGYVFDDPTVSGLESALERAIGLWFRYPEYFRQLRVNGMRVDFSWRGPCQAYLEIYGRLCAR